MDKELPEEVFYFIECDAPLYCMCPWDDANYELGEDDIQNVDGKVLDLFVRLHL